MFYAIFASPKRFSIFDFTFIYINEIKLSLSSYDSQIKYQYSLGYFLNSASNYFLLVIYYFECDFD